MILKSYLLLLVKAQELNPECDYLSVAEECANDCEIIFGQCLVECQLDPACITECARADYEVNFSMVAEKSKDEVSQYLIKKSTSFCQLASLWLVRPRLERSSICRRPC